MTRFGARNTSRSTWERSRVGPTSNTTCSRIVARHSARPTSSRKQPLCTGAYAQSRRSSSRAHNNLGLALLDDGRVDEALRSLLSDLQARAVLWTSRIGDVEATSHWIVGLRLAAAEANEGPRATLARAAAMTLAGGCTTFEDFMAPAAEAPAPQVAELPPPDTINLRGVLPLRTVPPPRAGEVQLMRLATVFAPGEEGDEDYGSPAGLAFLPNSVSPYSRQ